MTTTPFATDADVAAAWRALTDAEITNTLFLLEFGSAIIRSQVPDIDARVTAGTLSAVLPKGVLVQMVLRQLRNPDGYRSVQMQESIEDYSTTQTATRDATLSAGALYLSDSELALLRGDNGSSAFSITPTSPPVTCDVLTRAAKRRRRWDVC